METSWSKAIKNASKENKHRFCVVRRSLANDVFSEAYWKSITNKLPEKK